MYPWHLLTIDRLDRNNIPKKELSIILSQLNASFIKTSYNILIWDLLFFLLDWYLENVQHYQVKSWIKVAEM